MSSIYSAGATTIGGFARKMAHPGRPDITITVDNPQEIYTTFDAIRGKVEIAASHNARFDEIHITLEGTTRTHVQNMSPAGASSRTTAVHNFLKLRMPIRESDYPQPRIAEAGRTYTFPFNFVIPDQLLPKSCTHDCTADHVHDAHLQLPPTMGGQPEKDDLSPHMSKVTYAVVVKVVRQREEDGKMVALVEGSRKLHVIPAQAEAPPISIASDDKQYVLSKTKALRKGVFSGKLGKITVAAAQTGALMLPPPAECSSTPRTTMATIKLQFEPHDSSSQPPKLGGMTTKIKASTFYAVSPHKDLPTRGGQHIEFDISRAMYETSITINSRCVESVTWTKQTAHLRRKNSASSTSSSEHSSSEANVYLPEVRGPYYTATILVPINLPASKQWVPSFHSCTLSRVYQLDLSVTVHAPGAGMPSTTMTLHMPVQIGAYGSPSRRMTLTPAEAAAELAGAEEFLRPRVIEVPSEELVGNSVLRASIGASELPPSYEYFHHPRPVVDPGRG